MPCGGCLCTSLPLTKGSSSEGNKPAMPAHCPLCNIICACKISPMNYNKLHQNTPQKHSDHRWCEDGSYRMMLSFLNSEGQTLKPEEPWCSGMGQFWYWITSKHNVTLQMICFFNKTVFGFRTSFNYCPKWSGRTLYNEDTHYEKWDNWQLHHNFVNKVPQRIVISAGSGHLYSVW